MSPPVVLWGNYSILHEIVQEVQGAAWKAGLQKTGEVWYTASVHRILRAGIFELDMRAARILL